MSSNWSKIDKIPLANMKFCCEQSPGVQEWTQMPEKKEHTYEVRFLKAIHITH